MTVKERYDELRDQGSDIVDHLPTFVQLVTDLRATTVIELGVRDGNSTVAWLYGLEETGGHLWSVDVRSTPFGPMEGWTFIVGDDLSVDVLEQLPDDADIVFIDTSHGYEQTLNELTVYSRKVRPGGRLVLHDTELRHPDGEPAVPEYPVKTAVTEFCVIHRLDWTNDPRCYGLAIIEV